MGLEKKGTANGRKFLFLIVEDLNEPSLGILTRNWERGHPARIYAYDAGNVFAAWKAGVPVGLYPLGVGWATWILCN